MVVVVAVAWGEAFLQRFSRDTLGCPDPQLPFSAPMIVLNHTS